jgi:opacity protein-like surface antigen
MKRLLAAAVVAIVCSSPAMACRVMSKVTTDANGQKIVQHFRSSSCDHPYRPSSPTASKMPSNPTDPKGE